MEYNWGVFIVAMLFVVGGCFLFLTVAAYKSDSKKTNLRRDYMISTILLLINSFFYAIMTIADNDTFARMYWAIGFVSICMFCPQWCAFLANTVKFKTKHIRNICTVGTYLTAVFAMACAVLGGVTIKLTGYGNQFSYHGSTLFKIFFAWMMIWVISILVFQFKWRSQTKSRGKRRQITYVIVVSVLLTPIGLVTDFVLPIFTAYTSIPLASSVCLAVSACVYAAREKHRIFGHTVSNVSEQVFTLISSPVLVLNDGNIITLENDAAAKFMGGSVIGGNISEFVYASDRPSEKVDFNKNCENVVVQFITAGGLRFCDMTLTVEHDKYGEAVCKIVLLRDVTLTKKLEASLSTANERLMIMLDTSPICTQIWTRDLSTIDCNEAAVQLYGFKNKNEYARRFLAECSPEFQPCGQRSDLKALEFVNKAFETGYCRFDWTHIIPDKGEEFPADVTLVRSKYKNEDVVLGYSRDLREQYALMASIRYRDRMLQAVNEVAVMLLESDTDCFAEALRKSMSKIAGTVKADCVYVWKNHTVNGELFCKQMCEWSENNTVFAGDDTLYKYSETFPGWEVALANGESQNGPVSSFTESVQEFLKPVGALSILVLPIFIKEQFWGFIGFDDFKEERVFSKEEESILKSASLLIASAFVRNAMYDDIKSGSEELLRRDKIMYAVNTAAGILLNADSGFFNDSLKISMKLIAVAANVHCVYLWQNKTVDGELCCFQLFEWSESETKFTDGELYKYDEVVPGWKETLSAEKCINSIVRNLSREEQDHLTGILSIFVVPVFIRNEFWGFVGFDDRNEERIFSSEEGSILHSASLIVANSFIRNEMVHDIRETATQLEQSSNLLKTVNQVATTLLTTQEGEDITHSLNVGMELIGNAMKVDRVHIWRNEVVDGALRFMHAYSWLNEVGENMAVVPAGAMTPFKDHTKWLIKFMRNEYVGGGASKMTENEREYFKEFDVKSVVLIPLFLDEDFWGVVSIDDCMAERDFTEEEIAILRSASLVMASVINRHTLVEKRTVQLTMQAAQLKEMEAAAVAASQSKSVFLANMSHEIRTPMNAILGITEILIQNEGLPEEIDEGLGKIYNSCDMLLRIINDILDFSKIEAGRLDITPANYCVASLLNDSVHLNMMRIESKPIEFEVNVNKDVPAKLVGDELRIKQILNNLLSNAFKYTEKGKVILSVSYEPTDFESLVSFVIKVTDTGVGMSEEQLETMFNEYSRFAENSNSTVEGTGLGLAITQRLINLMDGQIEVESKPGVGSTFTVRFLQGTVDDEILGEEVAGNLQFFRDYYKKTRNRRSLVRYPMPYGKVLIVDDVETNVYVAAGLMKPYKLQIDSATSGQEAIDKIALGEVYDVIFMDHMMPGMNGIEATHKLREMNYTNPIVALTANAVAGQADMFLQNGFDAFISKPVDIRQLDTLLIHLVRDRHPPEVVAAARNESIGITSETPAAKSLLSDKSVQGIDISRGLERYNGDEEIYLRVLRSYAASVRSMVGVIESVSEKSLPDYEIKIHGIKGTSRDIFAQDIGESAAKLETAAKEKDILYINEHNSGFVKVLCEFLDRLDELLRIVDEQNPRELKEKLDEKLLVQLREACKVYDMDGADSAINEIEMFSYKSQSDLQLAEWLRERFDLMKFDEIVDKLDN